MWKIKQARMLKSFSLASQSNGWQKMFVFFPSLRLPSTPIANYETLQRLYKSLEFITEHWTPQDSRGSCRKSHTGMHAVDMQLCS